MAGNRLRIAIWGLAAALWLLPRGSNPVHPVCSAARRNRPAESSQGSTKQSANTAPRTSQPATSATRATPPWMAAASHTGVLDAAGVHPVAPAATMPA